VTVDFLVRRDDLRVWRAAESAASGPPAEGEVQLRVERFALTANNLTYGVAGDQLGYWRFFPAPEGWGRIPVWGFGAVTASGVEGIDEGDRFYGYFPMSDAVSMQARADGVGFVECSPARADLPPFYNRYLRATTERGFPPEQDDANAILRPLFMTGWLIADQLEQAGWHGADTVVLASASSKTAFTTAFEIGGRHDVVGLTSPAHRAFTEGLGCYARVITYDEVPALPVEGGIVLVDMAGSAVVRRAVHEHAGDALKASIMVGMTHWDAGSLSTAEPLPGPTPEFFFAPAQAERRAAELGPKEFQARVAAAWTAFAARAADLIEIEARAGVDALGRGYEALLDGTADPARGHVFAL
jgi:Protein of unknown function (DUF2855)